MQTSVGAKE